MTRYRTIIAGLCAVFCTGCFPGNPPPAPTVGQSKLFEDVPMMAGFAYQGDGSFLHVGKQRMCVLKYSGKADMLAVVKYYKDSMQANKWEHKTTMGIDPIIMQFNKAEEMALVVVQKLKAGEISLIIQISPKE